MPSRGLEGMITSQIVHWRARPIEGVRYWVFADTSRVGHYVGEFFKKSHYKLSYEHTSDSI